MKEIKAMIDVIKRIFRGEIEEKTPKKEVYILKQGVRRRTEVPKVIRGKIVEFRCSKNVCPRDGQLHSPLKTKETKKCFRCNDLEFVIVREESK